MKLFILLLVAASVVASASVGVEYEKAYGKDVSTTSSEEAPSTPVKRIRRTPYPFHNRRKTSILLAEPSESMKRIRRTPYPFHNRRKTSILLEEPSESMKRIRRTPYPFHNRRKTSILL
ncbi:hypothetical protein V3C99_015613, partial [Haemonchus contortus]